MEQEVPPLKDVIGHQIRDVDLGCALDEVFIRVKESPRSFDPFFILLDNVIISLFH